MATTDVDVTAVPPGVAPPVVAPPARSTLFGLPINRVVAFLGPYLAIASGAVADWLVVHVHLLALFHTTNTQVAGAITQLGVFGLTAILVWLGHHKWLTGWQQFQAAVASPATSGPVPVDVTGTVAPPEALLGGEYDPATAGEGSEPVSGAEVPEEPEMAAPGEEVELPDDPNAPELPPLVDDPSAIQAAPEAPATPPGEPVVPPPTTPFTSRRKPPK